MLKSITYSCDFCGNDFADGDELARFMIVHHYADMKKPNFECPSRRLSLSNNGYFHLCGKCSLDFRKLELTTDYGTQVLACPR